MKNEDKDNTGLVDGLLLYAKTDDYKIPNSTYNFGNNRISVQTLDLNKDFLDIKSQLNLIIDEWGEVHGKLFGVSRINASTILSV